MGKKNSVYYNYSGYYDPTAGRALDRVIRDEETLTDFEKEMKKRGKKKKRRKRAKKAQPCSATP